MRGSIKMISEGFEVAYAEARKSVEVFRLGAAFVHRARVVSRGRNKTWNSCGLPSVHAEMDAAWKLPPSSSARDAHLVVVRLMRNSETMGLSKPCAACMRSLVRLGVGKITYTTGDPTTPFETIRLNR